MEKNPELKCAFCQKTFTRVDNLKRHIKTHRNNDETTAHSQTEMRPIQEEYACQTCGKTFSRIDNLRRHIKTHRNDDETSSQSQTEMRPTQEEYACQTCAKKFSRKDALRRHQMVAKHGETSAGDSDAPKYVCNICEKSFSRLEHLKRHLVTHTVSKYTCPNCASKFSQKEHLQRHIKSGQCISNTSASYISVKRKKVNSSPSRSRPTVESLNTFKTVRLEPEAENKFDIKVFFDSITQELIEKIEEEINLKEAVKFHLILKVTLEKISGEGEVITTEPYLHSDTYIQLTNDSIDIQIQQGFAKILKCFDRYLEGGSGWRLRSVNFLELKTAKYNPLRGSSFIPLPRKIKQKNAVLNIKNLDDEKCIVWCILAAQLNIPEEDSPDDVSHYTCFESTLNLKHISFPMPNQQAKLLESQNNLRINIYGFEEGKITLLYISERENKDVINLLFIATEENQHYTLIKNFSRFLGDRTKHHATEHYCHRCLHGFSRADLLEKHTKFCKKHAAQIVEMPEIGSNFLKFKSTHMQHPIGYTIYADFECILESIDAKTPADSENISYTQKISKHTPCGYAYVVVGPDGKRVKPIKVYCGKDAVQRFLRCMIEEEKNIGDILMKIKPLKLTPSQEEAFRTATQCCICKKTLDSDRVREHNHLSGEYRGAAHANCNLKFKQPKSIPIIFHNLKNYDGHLLMCELGKFKDHIISVIANTLEKYITFKLKKPDTPVQLVFLDSFQFTSTSLEKLVNNLPENEFKLLREHFPCSTQFDMLKRKGLYPYAYFTSFEKFDETKLPPPEAFFNTLTGEDISDEDYEHALNVWNTFNLQTLREYHNLYVKTDVLLLADVFQNFRKLCLQYYEIDACHVFTAPGLSWNACLKMCDVTLELLTDIDMLLFFEAGVRGGVSQISHRFAVANIPETPNYNENKAASYIMYYDANKLYGWSMSQFLPLGGFEWVDVTQLNANFILNLSDESSEGYIFEVDLDYPKPLHDLHNDYPLAPERLTVEETMLSPYAKKLLGDQKYVGTPKLIPNLQNKIKYVTHYRNLKLYLQLGLTVAKFHRAIKFRQAPWLRKYIDFNTEKRKQATSEFEKDFFKFLNNSVFGKTMENLRKRRNIELCTDEVRAQKLVASPNYKNFKQFGNDLVGVERRKPTILMNRPIYVGFSILELSKVLMYSFHYNHIKTIYQNQAVLLFTDTDSLTYHITTPDVYDDLKRHKDLYDFSDYPKNHKLYSIENKKTLGKFKDELSSKHAFEFAGIKAKMYSIKTDDKKSDKRRAKGVSTRIVQKGLKHEDYVKCILKEETSCKISIRFMQEKHELFSVKQNKKCLSAFDDKRYLLSDGISSLAYGHKDIPSNSAEG